MFEINFEFETEEQEEQKVNTIEDGARKELDSMPYDHRFWVSDDVEESCHATGYKVAIDGEWWNEYIDSEGNFHYGR
jgi:hypothetical protein